MPFTTDDPGLLFLALLALYSPLAALSSYMPIVGRYNAVDQMKLAVGLFFNVIVFVLIAIWIGEPVLQLLGISTAALAMTGGIALLYAGVPMMRGIQDPLPAETTPTAHALSPQEQDSWRSVLFTPLTFPLTVGGTSFGILVAFASTSNSLLDQIHFSMAGVAYAVVTGGTVYAAGHVHRLVSARARVILERVAGILLTAIAVSLLANGGTRLVVDTLAALDKAT